MYIYRGQRLPRALVYVIACLTRASIKTLDEDLHKSLVKAAFENGCLVASAGHSDNAIPGGWDSPAFCSNLLAARSGDMANSFSLALNPHPGQEQEVQQERTESWFAENYSRAPSCLSSSCL